MSETSCPNCKRILGCSCELRNATNGVPVCGYCVATYEHEQREKARAQLAAGLKFTDLYKESNP